MSEEFIGTHHGTLSKTELLRISTLLQSHSCMLNQRPTERNKKIRNEALEFSEKIRGLF